MNFKNVFKAGHYLNYILQQFLKSKWAFAAVKGTFLPLVNGTCYDWYSCIYVICLFDQLVDYQCHIALLLPQMWHHMRPVMRKLAFCICENKDADQLHGNQCLCFCYTEYEIVHFFFFITPKFQASSHLLWR